MANDPYKGAFNASTFGPACPQQTLQYVIPDNIDPEVKALLDSANAALPDAEDCACFCTLTYTADYTF